MRPWKRKEEMNYEQVMERKDAQRVMERCVEHLRRLRWGVKAAGIGYDVTPPGESCRQMTQKGLFELAVSYAGFAVVEGAA